MKLYRHLAWDGIRKNSRLYVPYLLTGVGAVSFFYILVALSRLPEGTLPGSGSVQVILNLGSFVLWVFSLLLLFYTHSFLIRRRNREFALYNVLGMGKRDIARILCWETLLSGGISLAGGLALGILLSKLAELGLLRMVGAATDMVYRVSAGGLLLTLGLYGAIYLLILLSALLRVRRSTAVQLMRSQAEGEKPPRANWALAVLGILLLAGAYYLAVTIREPLAALTWFFAAVLMVILATYLLFISGSVTLCRLLQRNPRFYYQKRHFVSVSSLVYRMKRNGAGLASICILGTMVLVMLSSTTCMYYGVEDALHQRYPRDIGVECYFGDRLDQMDEAHLDILRAAVADAADAMGSSRDNVQDYRAAWLYGILTPDGALRSASDSGGPASEMTRVTLISLPDYNALTGTELTLSDGEVYVYGHRMTYTAPQFTVGDTTWRVKSLLDRCAVNGASAADVTPSLYVVVPDFESAARLLLDLSANSDLSVQLRWYYQFDSDLPDDAQHSGSASYGTDGVPANLTDALELALYNVYAETGLTTGWEVESLAANRSDFYGAYGGLFFLGIMLSVVFSLAAVSIIYYKQVCEGYEDQSRFAIMQKVGMTKQDIRRSINSQLLTVFFLPMALSGVHLCFAFPFIHKLLLLFNLSNTSLLIGTTVVSYVAFALLYTLAYKLTSNAYYHIVSGAAERE